MLCPNNLCSPKVGTCSLPLMDSDSPLAHAYINPMITLWGEINAQVHTSGGRKDYWNAPKDIGCRRSGNFPNTLHSEHIKQGTSMQCHRNFPAQTCDGA